MVQGPVRGRHRDGCDAILFKCGDNGTYFQTISPKRHSYCLKHGKLQKSRVKIKKDEKDEKEVQTLEPVSPPHSCIMMEEVGVNVNMSILLKW